MDILRVTARWSGFTGAPGYSAFHFAAGGGLISDAQQVADRVHSGLVLLGGLVPNGVTLSIQPEVERLDAGTGVLSDFHSITPKPVVTGTGQGTFSAASGAVVNWRTNDVRGGRRIRGRTFIVPLGGSQYDLNGTLAAGAITALNNFANAIHGVDFDSEFGVWSRPVNGAGGVFATVTGHSVPDMAAVLRSRRD